MEQLDIITIAFLALGILALAMGIIFVLIFYKPINGDKAQLSDDIPARYEEFEECFYNP